MSKSLIFSALAWFLISASSSWARTWTSSEGAKIEAEMVSTDGKTVTIRKSDGRRFTLPLEKLSADDQTWIKQQMAQQDELGALPDAVVGLVKERGSLLFEDDFNREDPDDAEALGPNWTTNSAKRAQGEKQADLVDGVLVMTLSPKADHAISIVHNTAEPYGDAVAYVKVKLEPGEKFKLAYNDKQYKPVWAGHINGVTIDEKSVMLDDEKLGRFSPEATAMKKDPSRKSELTELTEKYFKKFPIKLDASEWHDLVTVHNGENLTVYLDGKEIASHTSPGFGHETKRQFVFAVAQKASVDELKIWKLKPAG